MQKYLATLFVGLSCFCFAQRSDSVYHQLQAVEIKPESQESTLRLLSSESTINYPDLQKQSSASLVAVINQVPGVRMEERSPGSYRLSIRGSLLRSPFGIRNIKIYLGDLPFTDAGGNTYLNSLDIGNINGLKILKGPEASIFGANTGGVLLLDPVYKSPDTLNISANITAGSYGLFHENFFIQSRSKKNLFTINQGYQRSDGYRKNSAMERHYAQISDVYSYHEQAQLRFLVLFSDMSYQTPGGLTLQQFESEPAQARPATGSVPGAEQQKAAIYNKTVFGGATHDFTVAKNIRHVFSLFGSHTDFKNPFITNYEQRTEASLGGRTYVDGTYGNAGTVRGKWNLGAELQQTNSDISNFGNNAGNKASTQATDRLQALQSFVFGRFLVDIRQRLLIEVSASYNFFSYRYRNIYPHLSNSFTLNRFDPQLMPRLATSLKLTKNLSWRISASKGYSPPTLAEIRSSDNMINKSLGPETGLSYETGFRLRDNNDYMWFDISGFYYSLTDAVVRRVNDDGSEYFINSGGTKQPGLESQLGVWIVKPAETGFIRALQLKGNFTWNHFTFDRYKIGTTDFSGNRLTGVPDYTSAESIFVEFPRHLSINLQYYYSSVIPLNDANTVKSKHYHLLQLKAEYKFSFRGATLYLFAGADNLLNQVYSLGNDLNAIGGRYYNAAAPRNYYGGMKIEL